jgi:SsrA-binding protein
MKIYAENKKGRFNYEIKEEYEAGIVLTGPEVKSVKSGQISIKESYATVHGGEIFLTNSHISPYKPARTDGYSPTRSRKLLLSKREIAKIAGFLGQDGYSLIPLQVYPKAGLVKILLGLGRGKKKYDKRETIKKREQEREIVRALKNK